MQNYSHLQTTDRQNEHISLSQPASSVNGDKIPYLLKTVKLPASSGQRYFHYLPVNRYLKGWGWEEKPTEMALSRAERSSCVILCDTRELGKARVGLHT